MMQQNMMQGNMNMQQNNMNNIINMQQNMNNINQTPIMTLSNSNLNVCQNNPMNMFQNNNMQNNINMNNMQGNINNMMNYMIMNSMMNNMNGNIQQNQMNNMGFNMNLNQDNVNFMNQLGNNIGGGWGNVMNTQQPQQNEDNQINLSPPNPAPVQPFLTEEEQKKKQEQLIKDILNRPPKSSLANLSQQEIDADLNQLLIDMSIFGDSVRDEIIDEVSNKSMNLDKYMYAKDAIKTPDQNGYKSGYFVLGLLSCHLENHGIKTLIEKNPPKDKNEEKKLQLTMQFLINGLCNLKKYALTFDLPQQTINELFNDSTKQKNFNEHLRDLLSNFLETDKKNILLCNPKTPKYKITAIIKDEYFNEKTGYEIKKKFNENDIACSNAQCELIITGVKLNVHMLAPNFNNKDGGWGHNEKRAGVPYLPPDSWTGYGIKVGGLFDNGNDNWLTYKKGINGQWCIAYHGIDKDYCSKIKGGTVDNVKYEKTQPLANYNDTNHPGKKVGSGVYITPDPKVMETNCGEVELENVGTYKIGFMTRVNPPKRRIAKEQNNYWVINGMDTEVRPYRILLKKIK